MFDFVKKLFKDFYLFTAAYSNNIFPEPLSKDEEEKYVILANKGDINARNKLIEHNLRLVAHIVKKYDSKMNDNDDLISIGTIGLIKGVDTFFLYIIVKITTYCARCIENEILMYFRKNNKYSKDISIHDAVGYDKDGNEIEIQDILQVEDVDFCEDIDLKDNIQSLYQYMNILTPRERKIIIERYGLNNQKEETQKSISKKLGISRSYVSRIEKRALTKLLREFIRNRDKI